MHLMIKQEENLHRRSNLYQFLEDPDHVDSMRDPNLYPIGPVDALYSPSVAVFRDSEAMGYAMLPNVETLAVISAAATNNPDYIRVKGRMPWYSMVWYSTHSLQVACV